MGVVHISDYNRDIVLQYIQDDMLTFERKLRQLILLNGFTNKDMKQHFENGLSKAKNDKNRSFYQSKIINYEKNENEINALSPFQVFEFKDLMEFADCYSEHPVHHFEKYEISGRKKSSIEILRVLRNMAMHGKNPIGKDSESKIYSIESLQLLFDSLKVLRSEYSKIFEKIRSHPDFLRSIQLDNKSKLQIIHDYHPKAIEYFLDL
jgi:hypothetical protein